MASAALFGALGTATAASAAGCHLQQVADLHVVNDRGSPVVAVKVNDRDTQMIVGTGAAQSFMFKSAASRFGFPLLERSGGGMGYGDGGLTKPFDTELRTLTFGDATIQHVRMLAAGEQAFDDAIGLLGWDVLSRWDVEFDLAHHAVRLFTPQACRGDEVIYWTGAYSKARMERDPVHNWIRTSVLINGVRVDAAVDSGVNASMVTPRVASEANVKLASKPVGFRYGMGANPIPVWSPVFATFDFGGESIQNTQIDVGPMFDADTYDQTGSILHHRIANMPEMLLGADFLRSHRVLIATDQAMIYFTYEGGRVFRSFTDLPARPDPGRTVAQVEAKPSSPSATPSAHLLAEPAPP